MYHQSMVACFAKGHFSPLDGLGIAFSKNSATQSQPPSRRSAQRVPQRVPQLSHSAALRLWKKKSRSVAKTSMGLE